MKLLKAIFSKKSNSTPDEEEPIKMNPNVEYNMESIFNEFFPSFTEQGKSKSVQIVQEYAQTRYDYQRSETDTDTDAIYKAFLLFNENDSYIVHHKIFELTYNSLYCYEAEELMKQRQGGASAIRELFPEYDMENQIESILPGFGNIKHDKTDAQDSDEKEPDEEK